MTPARTVSLLGLTMLFGLGAATLPSHANAPDAFVAPPSVLAFDQKSARDVMIDYVYLPTIGYVAVYQSDASGNPTGKPIGHSPMTKGGHRNVEVPLDEPPKSGDRLWISLYQDADKQPSFDPGSGDTPVWSKDQLPAQNMIVVR
ncbi:MAG: hypothetical protein AB7U75_20655 [Hyphomicrobiaceae bacterium]